MGYDDGPARWRPRASLERVFRQVRSVAHRAGLESFRSRAGPYAGGESPATARAAPPDPITLFAPHAANRSPTLGPPVSRRTVREVTTVWLGRSDWSRRDTRQRAKRLGRGPIGGGGDSPVMHRSPGYRHDVHSRADQISRRRHRQDARGPAVFPRRRLGAKSPPHRCRFASVRR